MRALRAAWSAVAGHVGLLATTYAIQLAIAAVASLWLSLTLVSFFGSEPLFDRAVDGDVAALLTVFAEHPGLMVWSVALLMVALMTYIVVSWFITAGLIGVFVGDAGGDERGVRAFGRHGAQRFWSFVRLWLWTWILYIIVIGLLVIGLSGSSDDLLQTFSGRELLNTTLRRCAPALIALWLTWTVVDVARVDLVKSERPRAWRSILRAFNVIVRRPRTLAITLAGHLLSTILVMFGLWLGGVGGALATVVVRQLLLIARHAVHLGVLGAVVDATAEHSAPLATAELAPARPD